MTYIKQLCIIVIAILCMSYVSIADSEHEAYEVHVPIMYTEEVMEYDTHNDEDSTHIIYQTQVVIVLAEYDSEHD